MMMPTSGRKMSAQRIVFFSQFTCGTGIAEYIENATKIPLITLFILFSLPLSAIKFRKRFRKLHLHPVQFFHEAPQVFADNFLFPADNFLHPKRFHWKRSLDLKGLQIDRHYDGILLEDLGNLLANEIFSPDGTAQNCVKSILDGVEKLKSYCDTLVIVSNENLFLLAIYDAARFVLWHFYQTAASSQGTICCVLAHTRFFRHVPIFRRQLLLSPKQAYSRLPRRSNY